MKKRYVTIVHATRLYAKGDGWWEITLSCGHQGAVLHGRASPHGQRVKCFYRCEESPTGVSDDTSERDVSPSL